MSRVEDVMSRDVHSCHLDESLNRCAQIMWEFDCGCVPIVDHLMHLIGIVTDRDVCMGAYTQGRSLREIPVSTVCARPVYSIKASDTLVHAEDVMAEHQVRRLPVLDDQGCLIGVLSLSDLARHLKFVALGQSNALGPRNLSLVLEAVCRRRDHVPVNDKAATSVAEVHASP